MSSLAAKDLRKYLRNAPNFKATLVGKKRRVPLKVLSISSDKEWLKYLKDTHGLIDSPRRLDSDGFRYWHDIFVLKLTPKHSDERL